MRKSGISGALIAALFATFAVALPATAASDAVATRDLDGARLAFTDPGLGSLTVNVTAWLTGTAATGGCVSISPAAGGGAVATQCTGSTGTYLIDNVVPGSYVVRAYNFASLASVYYGPATTTAEATPVTVAADSSASIAIKLPPTARILQRLLDSHGAALVGVTVQLYPVSTTTPTTPIATATTDIDGWYMLTSSGCGNSCRIRFGDTGEVRTSWYPGVASRDGATLVGNGTTTSILPTLSINLPTGSLSATLARPDYATASGDACLVVVDLPLGAVVTSQCGPVGTPVTFDRLPVAGFTLCYRNSVGGVPSGASDCLADGLTNRVTTVVADAVTPVPGGFGDTVIAVTVDQGATGDLRTDGCVKLLNPSTLATVAEQCTPTGTQYLIVVPPVATSYKAEAYSFDGVLDERSSSSFTSTPGATVNHRVVVYKDPQLDVQISTPSGSGATQVCAGAYDLQGIEVVSACVASPAGSTGEVRLSLPPGMYRVKAYANVPNVAATWLGGNTFADASTHRLTALNNSDVGATLVLGGRLGGVVTNAANQPVEDACIRVFTAVGNFADLSCSDASGNWNLGQLPVGSYFLYAEGGSGLAGYWVGGGDPDSAQRFTVTAGAITTANIHYAIPGTLQGTVTGPGGVAATGGCVAAYRLPGVVLEGETCDDTSGAFTLELPAGSYALRYHGWSTTGGQELIDRWSGSTLTANGAASIVVQAGAVKLANPQLAAVTGVLTLHPTVTRTGSSETRPAINGCIYVYDTDGWFVGEDCDTEDGTSTFHLPPGDYAFFGEGFTYAYWYQYVPWADYGSASAGDSWNGGSMVFEGADLLRVASTGDSNFDLELFEGARIEGTVTDPDWTAYMPVTGGFVVAYDPDSGYEFARGAIGGGGRYALPYVPTGSPYVLGVVDVPGYPDQYLDSPRPLLPGFATARTVPVAGLYKDLSPWPGGDLTGRFFAPEGYSGGEICADLYYPETELFGGVTLDFEYFASQCGGYGEDFLFKDLPSGSYSLAFSDVNGNATWHAYDWFKYEPSHINVDGGVENVAIGATASVRSGSTYVPGGPVTLDVMVSPHVTATSIGTHFRPAGQIEWQGSDVAVSVTGGNGSVTFVPPQPGWYAFTFAVSTPNFSYQWIYTNTVWIGPPSPDLEITGPSSGLVGQDVVLHVTADLPVTGNADLWVKPDGGVWSMASTKVALVNGVGSFTTPVRSTAWEYGVEFNYGASEPFTLTPFMPTVTRVGGESRYDVAVGISQQYFPGGAATVYIAAGGNFPDALGAAPAAALSDAPLLLVPTDSIPASVKAELARLDPDKIIVTGGPASVSDAVLMQLQDYATIVTRITGADRYEVSRKVTRDAFEEDGSTIAYIATGATFPDALSASAAAGSLGAPVILLYGAASTLDSKTAQLLEDLGVEEIRIAGGPASVSPGIATALQGVPGVTTVTRLTGEDRFIVSGATNRAAFTHSDVVFIASGYTFPDALAGAPVAGALGAPLYVIPSSCIPGYVLDDIANLSATEVRILGGPGSVTPEAAALRRC